MESPADLEARVRQAVAEGLALPVEEVSIDHYLTHDLDAESLDFLDIVFKIEQDFSIEITRGEMERAARGDMSDEQFAPEGVISEDGLDRLRELMPESADRIEEGLRPMQILGLFKVRTLANIVRGKLEGRTL